MLGGSRFVGRRIAEAAVENGHDVTVFNRGRTGPAPDGCTQVIGDRRAGDLSELAGGHWDAVIDVCGYTAADVKRSALALGGGIEHYCFISTGAVYAVKTEPTTEDTPLVEPYTADPTDQELITRYAELKVACELTLRELLGDRLSVVRPGVVVGAGDYTDRLTYWLRRVADGGEVLGPPRAQQPLQLLHAMDLAEKVLGLVAAKAGTTVNVAGPEISFLELTRTCAAASGSDTRVVWGGPEQLPLAAPADGSHDGAFRLRSTTSDITAGNRPLLDTCREMLAWDDARGRPALRAGVGIGGRDVESALLTEVKKNALERRAGH